MGQQPILYIYQRRTISVLIGSSIIRNTPYLIENKGPALSLIDTEIRVQEPVN
jgi:hypothetical protein